MSCEYRGKIVYVHKYVWDDIPSWLTSWLAAWHGPSSGLCDGGFWGADDEDYVSE